jgi:D-3-phosphoglycerate dehydrogenase
MFNNINQRFVSYSMCSQPLVVITDADYPDQVIELKILKRINAKLEKYNVKTDDEIIRYARDAEALLNQFALITEKVFSELKRLKIVVRYGIGLDNIDVKAATKKGVIVCKTIYDTVDVADHAVALLLVSWRRLKQADKIVREGKWDWKLLGKIKRFSGSTIGIIGFGSIGRMVANRLKGFNVRILVYDPYIKDEEILSQGCEPKGLNDLLKQSDAITLHVPLTNETHHMIGEREFEIMKEGAIIVNTCRGSVIDTEALLNALSKGKVSYAGLDVLEEEPPSKELLSKLNKHDNLILSPHLAWYSVFSLMDVRKKAAMQIVQLFEGKIPEYIANPEVLKHARAKNLLKL